MSYSQPEFCGELPGAGAPGESQDSTGSRLGRGSAGLGGMLTGARRAPGSCTTGSRPLAAHGPSGWPGGGRRYGPSRAPPARTVGAARFPCGPRDSALPHPASSQSLFHFPGKNKAVYFHSLTGGRASSPARAFARAFPASPHAGWPGRSAAPSPAAPRQRKIEELRKGSCGTAEYTIVFSTPGGSVGSAGFLHGASRRPLAGAPAWTRKYGTL